MTYISYLHMTWSDAAALNRANTIGLIPTGAVEQHGPHLPVATDMLIAEELGRRTAEASRFDVVVAPVLPAGMSDMHLQFPGTVSVSEAVFRAYVSTYIEAFERIGILRIAVFSAHGGNFPTMSLLERDGSESSARVIAYSKLDGYVAAMFEGAKAGGIAVPGSDQHGGGVETSQMLASHPDLVRSFSDVSGFVGEASNLRQAIAERGLREMSPSGVMGTPSVASAAAGEQIYERISTELTRWIDASFS